MTSNPQKKLVIIEGRIFPFILIFLHFSLLTFSQKTIIAFGSCSHQDDPLPILDTVVSHHPEFFIFLGDNIYGDTKNMNKLKERYAQLASQPGFKNLKNTTKIFATWDDHDFGQNDAGKNYRCKKESAQIFLDFFEEPANSERRQHEGIYVSYIYENDGKKIQVILLDNRTFRDDLRKFRALRKKGRGYFYARDYLPHKNSQKTILGATQWAWLESELKKPADLRLIGSSTQFGAEYNGYETWANFPHEKNRMLELLKKTRANGVIFLSGDSHYAEISKTSHDGLYPIYDITSSGLTQRWEFPTPNRFRFEGPVMENNFGIVEIDWNALEPFVSLQLWDGTGNERAEYKIKLSELVFK